MKTKHMNLICIILAVLVVLLAALCVYQAVSHADTTTQYMLYKNVISQDEVEETLFGQPISPDRDGEYRIGIETAIDGDFHAKLTVYQAQGGKYVEVFSCDAVVGKNGPGKHRPGRGNLESEI